MNEADEQPDRRPGNTARLVRQILNLRDTDDRSAKSLSCSWPATS